MKKAVIFDLDGVIVSTDKYHYEAWKEMADKEGIYFDEQINNRLRGVSRMESLEIILEKADKSYTQNEKDSMANEKNAIYSENLSKLTPEDILIGAMDFLTALKEHGIKIAIGSSSRNTPKILHQIGLSDFFDAVADGNSTKNSKPHPEVFLLAAKLLKISPEDCVVIEDAVAGIDAAKLANMKAVGVGDAASYEFADLKYKDMTEFNITTVLE